MKKLLLASTILLAISISLPAQSVTDSLTIVFVRHAEKGTDDKANPSLSEIGNEMAEALVEFLTDDFELNAIYSTPYKRTRETALPASLYFELDIQEYNPRESKKAIEGWVNDYGSKTLLVVGHSNTTPMMVNILLGSELYSQLAEDEYDKIFIVKTVGIGKSSVVQMSY